MVHILHNSTYSTQTYPKYSYTTLPYLPYPYLPYAIKHTLPYPKVQFDIFRLLTFQTSVHSDKWTAT